MINDQILALLTNFGVLSLLAFGGMVAALPDIQRRAVDVHHWMDERTFAELYGLGYAMPGPNVLVATLVGYQIQGAWGAFVATTAMLLPSMVLAFFVSKVWHRFREAQWRRDVQAGLLSIVVGLTLAGGFLIARAAAGSHEFAAYGLTLATIAITMRTNFHPLWMIAFGAGLGLAGIV